jgi:hypothetical protein
VTTLMILPGSANLFGGRSVTVRNVPSITMQGMKFPNAPYGLKMACGENPKRVYGGKGRSPSTAMGNVFGFRKAWIDAAEYRRKWDDYNAKTDKGEKADAPKRDLQMETLLPRRRDGGDDRYRPGVRLPDHHVPPRQRGLQTGRGAGEGRHLLRHLGRLAGLQDGVAGRH